MLKIASASGAPPQTALGSLRRSPRPPSREGLLAFGNRSFAPLALALSPNFSRSVPPKVTYRFSPLALGHFPNIIGLQYFQFDFLLQAAFAIFLSVAVDGLLDPFYKIK